MTERAKYLTVEWIRDFIAILGVVGIVFGVYVSLTERVTASEQKITAIEGTLEDYKDVPPTLARIEEQISSTRKDIARIETKLK